MENGALDVVVRFHDVQRIGELERCLLSLMGQSFRPLNVLLSLQRFDDEELGLLQDLLALLDQLGPDVQFRTLNFTQAEPVDARSALINAGFQAASGRYFACLDYDDVTKPNAYAKLIGDLKTSGAAITFGKVLAKTVTVDGPIHMTKARTDTIAGAGLVTQLRENFCPIHSFVIDRSKVDLEDLYFEPRLCRHEDYDFLIRFCAKYPSSFRLKEYVVGDYSMKDDGSNTIMVPSSATEQRWSEWRWSDEFVARRRATTRVALRVQRQLGLAEVDPELTVQGLLSKQA